MLQAPAGAGKTTRVPLALLELMPPGSGRIIMLEPRRIAAVSAARWMAHTLGEDTGGTVGYTIRFDSRVTEKTRLEVVTEGILTRRIQRDPGLEGVAMVIFDEFHERSLHADLALALCLDVRRNLREDLKILVMSATLDCGPVASLLDGAPVISSQGRAFAVEERYLPNSQKPLAVQVVDAVSAALRETTGDILVFLPGSGEIHRCSEALMPFAGNKGREFTLHPLYGDLPFEEQERAILPSEGRKIVLATNIAETSLTIEGVKVVIDSGLTRRLRHDASSGMNRLITVSVSKASADQRKGRAGRLGPGICYRLYSRAVYQALIPFSPAEILVSDLSSLALELAVWGVKDPSLLSWLNEPPAVAWDSAVRLLTILSALDASLSITQTGRTMACLPLHPRLSRMMVRAGELQCAAAGADLAALLSEREIILREKSDHPRGRTSDPDILARFELLHSWRTARESPAGADRWALRAVERTSEQLRRLMPGGRQGSGKGKPPDDDLISRLLLCAFPDRIAMRRADSGGRFVLSQGRGVRLLPAGSMAASPFIIALNVDAGEKAEGTVHVAATVTEELIRQELPERITTLRRVEWDKRQKKIIAALDERLGVIPLSSRPFTPSDGEALPLLCDAIRSDPGMLTFSKEAAQFQGRVMLMKRTFPEESWPDLSNSHLMAHPEEWLLPWLGGLRTSHATASLDILPALRALITRQQSRILDERAPACLTVPSGSNIRLDYTAGDIPVLAVKLQEMFGLADTPEIADSRIKVLLHLLSPARRPVQITRDLKGFWNTGYQQVRKELKGRYPRHPWPEDPWNALPTQRPRSRPR